MSATWPGWLLPAGKRRIAVRNADQDPAELLWPARRIGYDHVSAGLAGGLRQWARTGQPTASIPLVTAEHVGDASVLDIQQATSVLVGGPYDRAAATGRCPEAAA